MEEIPPIEKEIPLQKDSTTLGDMTKDIKHLDQNVKVAMWVMLAVVITAIFSLGGIVNDYLAMKQATYADLRDKVTEQNIKIDTLQEQLRGAKYIYIK